MQVTDVGMLTLLNPVQFRKASIPIDITEEGIEKLLKFVQPSNIQRGMFVTLLVIVAVTKPVQPAKAL